VKRTLWLGLLLAFVAVLVGSRRFDARSTQPDEKSLSSRESALARARIFLPSSHDLAEDKMARPIDRQLTICSFVPSDPTGTTPKFDCRLRTGEKIKVKYGWTREIPTEVAATHLLRRLGFGADYVWRVDTLRCFGCVISPFHVRSLMKMIRLDRAFDSHLNYQHPIDFVNVSVERKLPGESIEAGPLEGWGFDELARIDQSAGGARPAEVDALRLMAVFLNHWDNKPSNQRLVCVDAPSASCEHPLAMLQDTGSDFGPYKLNLEHWKNSPLWKDPARCSVSMRHLPFHGGTFPDTTISEAGRRVLGDRLMGVSRAEVAAIFTDAGFTDVQKWVDAFGERVETILRASCPIS